MNSHTVLWEGRSITFTWHEGKDLEKFHPWSQVYAFCFTKSGKLLIVKNKYWSLPGGGREDNETPEENLRREILEEANTAIGNYQLLGAQEVHDPDNKHLRKFENTQRHFQLRYAAIIEHMGEPAVDPSDNVIYERKLIDPKEFSKYVEWGQRAEAMVSEAVKWFEQQR